MKNKKQAVKQIEEFLETELTSSLPITILSDNSIVYKRYRIKQSKSGTFKLHFSGLDNRVIGEFNLKACALLAAKRHDKCQLSLYEEVKELDTKYWVNFSDAKYFQEKIKKTVNGEKYDILSSRLDLTKDRAKEYKIQILKMFRYAF